MTSRQIFTAATSVAIVHGLDDAFVHRGPGVGLGQHALAGALTVAGGLAAIALFPRLRAGLQALVAFYFGALALINGAMHVKDFAVTGVLAAAAGLVLVGLSGTIAWRHRRQRHWAYRAASVPVAIVVLFYTIVPVGMAITETHKFRGQIGPAPAGYREVAFRASDGVKLSGWYRPTGNGATVLVLHGGGGNRTGAYAHARMLARHGYGVLLWDARGRGRSEGTQNAYGWGWDRDVAGALAYLKTRPEVDAARVGGLGLSTGADVLVQAAGQHQKLAAVVADGTAAESFEDWRRVYGTNLLTPFLAAEFAAVRVTSGGHPGPPMEEMIKRVRSPLLLISAGTHEERAFNRHYERVAPVAHWNLPRAGHTAGLRQEPTYEQRVTAFFDSALTPPSRARD
jgi:NAD(P)-dependent dehydrogenase (short-subunit alcohol dehydrogenase family)